MTPTLRAAPTDADARHRILTDLDRTLFVEAGAGSGKTSSLVGRFVALVLGGADVAGIAAITFTEAAAAELRARIREALEDVVAGRAIRGIEPDAAGVERARRALDQLDRATISTLHAFAQRILLSAPIEAGLPPRVEVHDEISSALRAQDRWAAFVSRLLDDDELEVTLVAALSLDIQVDHLAAVAATFAQNWDLLVDLDLTADRGQCIDRAAISLSIQPLLDAAALARDRLRSCADPDADRLARWIRDDMDEALAPLLDAAHDPYVLLKVAGDLPKVCAYGSAKNWPDDGKPEIQGAWRDACARITEARAVIADRVLRRLAVELVEHTLVEAAARRREGRLEFHDLLVLARQVLRDDRAVRRRLHARYQHLLIDEFQDTDPIQIELAVRIAADPDHPGDRAWHEIDVDPGRLFFVGDPKQSIYRFRRADIDLFVRTAERHPDGTTRLDTNFRTVEPIVAFCNQVFGTLIAEERITPPDGGRSEVAQPHYSPLEAWRPALADDPGPAVVLVGGEEKEATADSLRAAEATDIVATLVRARRDGWLVHPEGDEAPRACRWSDMAVLLPSRTSLSHLRRALTAAQVPYRLETGSLVYATTEVRELLALLHAVDDPGDEIAVLGALRSRAYGCGDDDLLAWARAGYSWNPLVVDDDATGPVADACRDLRDRHRSRPFRTVPELVDDVVRDRRLLEISLAAEGHRDVWRLYRVVVEHARQFADAEPGGLREFLRWASLQSDDKRRATAPVLPEADVDAVRILTVHGAKGLEFGITAVSGLSGQFPNGARGATVRFRPDGGFDVRMKRGLETAQFDDRATVEDVMGEHEGIRLLYVALTRARDHLVVSLHHKTSPSVRCHAHRLASAIDGGDLGPAVECIEGTSSHKADHDTAVERPIEVVTPVAAEVTADATAAWQAELDRWRAARTALLGAAQGGGAVSATALSRHLAARAAADADADGVAADLDGEHPEPEREPWRRGRAGTSVGAAVHAVLQHADLADPTGADLPALAAWQAGVEGVPHAVAEIEAKARAALTSDLVRRAVAGRWWREVHVGVPVAAIVGAERDVQTPPGVELFEGFVDLLFDDGDGLVVVDYKTDAVPDDRTLARALDRYAPQGAAYAVAVEAALGRPVRAVHFLFLRGDVAVDAPVPDLAARAETVRQTLATWSTHA